MPDTTPYAPRTWKLALAYDGTDYSGWQVQPNRPTVQQELASALHHVTSETILPQGSGRTDAGVHAMAQVVSFELRANIPPENLLRALNRSLPPAIRVLNAEVAPDGFHARHDALRKTYEYRIYRGEICPPFVARYVFPLNWPLNIDAMQYAAPQILGEHDFLSFAAVDPDLTHREPDAAPPSTVRTILHSAWTEHDAILTYRVTGTGFLHHMVRNLVGTFLDIGRGHRPPDSIPAVLAARDRAAAGPTARASGLFLVSVEYSLPSATPSSAPHDEIKS